MSPRKPDHLKIVAGTAQPCRMNRKAPKPKRTRPEPPPHLNKAAAQAWRELAALTDGMGVLTDADIAGLEGAAEALADLREARASLAQPLVIDTAAGPVTVAKAGERFYWTHSKDTSLRRARPELAAISDADRRFLAWLTRFGGTPADRARVSVNKKDDAPNAIDELFGT